ncbi:hypothetical protein AOLI_G00021570 [Acnodon oligacanthus]
MPKSRQAQQGMSRDLFFDCSQMRAAPDEARASLLEPGVITRARRGVQLLRSTASFTYERGRGGERLEWAIDGPAAFFSINSAFIRGGQAAAALDHCIRFPLGQGPHAGQANGYPAGGSLATRPSALIAFSSGTRWWSGYRFICWNGTQHRAESSLMLATTSLKNGWCYY